jgi:glycosyltransferase involved in cell wall biosynthesis
MRITIIAPYAIFPADTGGKRAITALYQHIGQLAEVSILTESGCIPPVNFLPDILPVLGRGKLRYINPMLYFKIKNILKRNNSQHLIIDHPYMGWIGFLLKKFQGITLTMRSHNIESLRFKTMNKWWWKIMWAYEKWVHRNADINWFITEEDKTFAVQHFKLNDTTCDVITYGTKLTRPPEQQEKERCRKKLLDEYQLADNTMLCLFTGVMDYLPNTEAAEIIIKQLAPLMAISNTPITIFICGKKLPEILLKEKSITEKHVIYTGFVEDIDMYYKGADIFINPVLSGGGIKTKLIDALANNLTSISTKTGAFGVSNKVTGDKLTIIEDGDWQSFVTSIKYAKVIINTPDFFYKSFNWGYIASKAIRTLTQSRNKV